MAEADQLSTDDTDRSQYEVTTTDVSTDVPSDYSNPPYTYLTDPDNMVNRFVDAVPQPTDKETTTYNNNNRLQPPIHSTQSTTLYSQSQSPHIKLHCQMDYIDNLTELLNTLVLQQQSYRTKQQVVTVTLLYAGIKFTVHKSQSLCIKLYIKCDTFYTYQLRSSGNGMKYFCDINVLIKCLSIFHSDSKTRLDMEFYEPDTPIKLTYVDYINILIITVYLY